MEIRKLSNDDEVKWLKKTKNKSLRNRFPGIVEFRMSIVMSKEHQKFIAINKE